LSSSSKSLGVIGEDDALKRAEEPGWWYIPIIPALGRQLRQETHKFKASLSYIMSSRSA
jgi:hypothetical protein